LRRQQEQVQRELKKPGVSDDRERMKELLREVERISRALRDPGLAEAG
jgi:preprotein translocase subunit Sss1